VAYVEVRVLPSVNVALIVVEFILAMDNMINGPSSVEALATLSAFNSFTAGLSVNSIAITEDTAKIVINNVANKYRYSFILFLLSVDILMLHSMVNLSE
jgi:hypothetical protein